MISTSIESFYNNPFLSDITLICGNTKFYAHKLILSIFSETFKKMFSSGLEESKKTEIQLQCQTDPKIFSLLLQFIYFKNCKLDKETTIPLLTAANFYGVSSLVDLCSNSLESQIDEDNVCYLLIISQMNNSIELKTKCLEFIMRNFSDICNYEGFNKLDIQLMKEILTYQPLVDEEIILDTLSYWFKENQDHENLNLFKMINYNAIDLYNYKFTSDEVAKYVLFLKDQIMPIQRKTLFFEVIIKEGDNYNYCNFPMVFIWEIPEKALQIEKDKSYESPKFTMGGVQWYLDIYPNGQSENLYNCYYLNLCNNTRFICLKYKMYLEGVSPTSLSKNKFQRNIFKENGSYGFHGQRWSNGSYHEWLKNGHVRLRLEVIAFHDL